VPGFAIRMDGGSGRPREWRRREPGVVVPRPTEGNGPGLPRPVHRSSRSYCGSPFPRQLTRSFQSLKIPAGFDFQSQTWIW